MAVISLPTPTARRSAPTTDYTALEKALKAVVRGDVRFDAGARAAYSTDASNYRQVPIAVVCPVDVDDAVAAVKICHEHDVPLLNRGGGTSLGGECCNVAVVLDWTKHVHGVESVDPVNKKAIILPGTPLDDANKVLAEHDLIIGPKPATHSHCTIGGMVGNNSCGATAQWSGTMAANVSRLEILTYDGLRMWVGPTAPEEFEEIVAGGGRKAEIYRSLRDLYGRYAEQIKTRFPDIPRRISGFNLPDLSDMNVARALVGSESTCVTVLRVEVDLMVPPKKKATVVLGYPDLPSAADAVPEIAAHDPIQLEAADEKLFLYEREEHRPTEILRFLPDGRAWLVVQLGADTEEEVRAKASALAGDRGVILEGDQEERLSKVREAGLATTARTPNGPDAWPGWEDSAVAPDRLGDYLRAFLALLNDYGYGATSIYGHFGQGCVHCSIPFDLTSVDGIASYRSFVTKAARLCVEHHGSLSGEHGDGQARGELLGIMYGEDVVRAFEEFKAIFDPRNRMNPGKVVHARPLDHDLRLGADYAPAQPVVHFGYHEDDGSFARAALRCAGVGECRRSGPTGEVMCPSYQVTRDEEHSTRGRARLLFEMLNGGVIDDGWRSTAVRDSLDLCLACKGCKHDCPVQVDMATYKAEFLSHHYAGRIRPLDHYSLGWLPAVAQAAALAPGLANTIARIPLAKRLAGVDPKRDVPKFAPARIDRWLRKRRSPKGTRGQVLLFTDSFTTAFSPGVMAAAVGVLEAAGFEVVVPPKTVCCGLTWISTGQLGIAERVLRRTVDVLSPYVRKGLPVVGLEPSCTAVFRSDLSELFGRDQDADRLARQTHTLAELLLDRAPDFQPRLSGGPVKAIVQKHCHHHAILGFDADRQVMERTGVEAEEPDSGCCGLAGNFGMTPGHRDVSLACAEQGLLPAVREAAPSTLVLADGFSCRTQIDYAHTGKRPLHLAEVLNAAVRGDHV
ncbi:FAD-binding and (Fe-S)-binding domain-containing protein [Actinoplanes subtropicus]|uniref:FAD-binding and (Fe-S)-binding domain-containing protein n=1 Tax=Actinoplanes subtropicus TaxID=543632 RepID=UPI0004C3D51B|nr:FAD-binding and (Fe-S)-binding domain-containing protein [Actinoplanes subtropicus]